MVERGLIKETKRLLDFGFDPSWQSLNTVGYKQILSYLDGDLTLDRAVEIIQAKTRQYAKRQLTWFRRWPFIHWLDIDQLDSKTAFEEIQKLVAAHHNNC
jgi:tRNA dimethylallyltransferase